MNDERISEREFRRSNDSELYVDPGFVHHRKIEAIIGPKGSDIITNQIAKIPLSTPEWIKTVLIDGIYSRILLDFCKLLGIRTIDDCLRNQNGKLMCSIEKLLPTDSIYESERAISQIELKSSFDLEVELHYSVDKISSDTLKSGLNNGGEFAIVAQFNTINESKIVLHPLLIGYPYLHSKSDGELSWNNYNDFYQLFIEDFDEFAKAKEIETPADCEQMKFIKESVFKKCLNKILGDSINKDWGGETSDYYSTHMHLGTNRISCAFLLKGAANFRPMGLNHLGKNNDQIVRLSKEPVDVLIVQHSHDILPAVKETLKVFATQPSNPRRYCLIDGRDSLRLLKAYDLLDWAIEESK